jgi:tol-pal system protein YbgF
MAIGLSLGSITAQAEVPVENLNSDHNDTSGMSDEQRLSRLENIVAAQNSIDLLNQIQALQKQNQNLQGKVDLLQRELNELQDQMKQQYSDLDNRFKHLTLGATQSPVTGDAIDEHKVYEKAYSLIKAQKYVDADKALNAYIKKYPHGSYVANAHYWLGEVALAQGKISPAMVQFKIVSEQFSKSNKAADALFKQGSINAELGNKSLAKQQLKRLIKDYSKSSVVKSAKFQLLKLK